MMKCIKEDGFTQVKGNEDKIIEALLNNDYYDEWKVHKGEDEWEIHKGEDKDKKEDIFFDLCRKNKGLRFVNYPQVYFKIEDTGEILVSMNMAPITEVYYATTFFPEPENESIDMIRNASNFIQLNINHKRGEVISKLTLRGKTYTLQPGDILLFNQTNELAHVLQDSTLQTLIHNGFYRVDLNEI